MVVRVDLDTTTSPPVEPSKLAKEFDGFLVIHPGSFFCGIKPTKEYLLVILSYVGFPFPSEFVPRNAYISFVGISTVEILALGAYPKVRTPVV